MSQWSEAWLREYQAKRQAAVAVPASASISFTLNRPTPLLNVLMRMHWRARGKYQRSLSAEIASKVPHVPGRQPFQRATMTITRFSVGVAPDEDGLIGGTKILQDCLLIRSTRHPDGLGIIVDDSPGHLTVSVKAIRCRTRKEQRTEVVIHSSV